MNTVYDPEKQKDFGPDELREKENSAHRMDDEEAEPTSPGELAALDQIGAGHRDSPDTGVDDNIHDEKTPKSTNIHGDETEQGNDESDPGFKFRNEKRKVDLKGLATRKSTMIGGGIVGSIVGLVVAASVALPSFMINHLREMILGRVSQIQTNQSIRYRRSKLHKIGDAFSKNGRMGGKIISEMELKGYEFGFDAETKNKITEITAPNGRKVSGDLISGEISDHMERRHPLRTSRWKTKRMEAFYTRYGISRTSVVRKTSNDLADPDRTVNKNLAGSVYDNGYDPRIIGDEPAPDDESADQRKAREARNQARREVAGNNGAYDNTKNEIKTNGTPISAIDDELAKISDQIPAGVNEDVLRAAENIADGGSLGSKTWSTFKGLGAADLLDKVCTIQNRLRGAQVAARTARAAGMLKYAMVFVSASDDSRTGNTNSKLMSSLMKRITKVDKNGNSFGSSPAFKYAMSGTFDKDQNEGFKSSYGVDGKLSGVYGGINKSVSDIPGIDKSKCGIYQNPVFQIGAAIIEIGLGIFTGGESEVAVQAGKEAAKKGVKEVIEQAIKKVVNRQLVKSLAKTAAIELSFEGIMALTQMYAEKSLNYNFTTQEVGGELSGILIGGGGTANKQRSLKAGFVPATTEQYAVAEAEYTASKAEDLKTQSLYARVFDYNNPDSVAFSTLASMPMSISQANSMFSSGLATLISSIANYPQTLLASASTALMGKSYAQSANEVSYETYVTQGDNPTERLATDPAGNVLPVMRADIEAIDPETNIRNLIASGDIDPTTHEPLSEVFKNHVSNCVEDIDIISRIEWGNSQDPAEDCLANLETTKMFKAHLAYIDMMDGLEAEFAPEELTSGNFDSLLSRYYEQMMGVSQG
ncbi:hypothetical protein H0X10_03690 [Candidatus Saccharibacteria bacterium]|nr:hypothetical protein [Candidatus Saccharibacteria bacterium]